MSIPDPYGRSVFHGRPGDNATIAFLKEMERILGYQLTIFQFIGDAGASANSHTKGRMADLAAWDWRRKLKVAFDLGGFGYMRPFRAGVWGAHCHIGTIFENRANQRGIADVGWRQIASWDNLRDGLVSNNRDFFTYRPDPKQRWSLADYERTFAEPILKPTATQLVRNEIVTSIHNLGDAIAKMSEVKDNRIRVHAQAQPLVEERVHLKAILAAMPLR